MRDHAFRWWAALLLLASSLSGCAALSDWLGGVVPSAGFDISNPKNLAHLCTRNDQTVDWQVCFTQVNQLCGKENHPVRVDLHAPLKTRKPFYNGYYISFQCEEGYSDGQALRLPDPVTGLEVVLQPPPLPEPQPVLDFGDDAGDTPPSSSTPPDQGTPPAAQPSVPPMVIMPPASGTTPPDNGSTTPAQPPVNQIPDL